MELEEFKSKYASVLELVQKDGVNLTHMHVQDGKFVLTGAAPNQDIVNELWNQIKTVDANYEDLAAEFTVDASLPQPAAPAAPAEATEQKYTVVAGDSLSKISHHFYGSPNHYMKIFEANKDQLTDPNEIQIGQELVIPA